MTLSEIMSLAIAILCLFGALYWRLQFGRAQRAAESLFFLANEGATSYDNGIWHEGVCEGEVHAAAVLEDTRQILMRLPGKGEYFTEMWQGELPF